MTSDPYLTPLAASLPDTAPFIGPEQLERARGGPFSARLGANELGFGPSPRAIEALSDAAPDSWKYCDPSAHDLRAALAERHGILPEQITVGVGIDGLLGTLLRLVIAPGDVAVTTAGSYPTFNYHVTGYGGHLKTVPYQGDMTDLEALAETARASSAKILYLANPDNPMGGMHGPEAIDALLAALPERCLLLLDEAYIETAELPAPDMRPDDPRQIRMRTFSKAYGLAGLRIGYGISAAGLIRSFDRVRDHFGVNALAQRAAIAALKDEDYLAQIRQKIAASRARIAAIGESFGLRPLRSHTNFQPLDCGADGARARAILRGLEARDVFIRMPALAPQDRCIRVSCGPEAEVDIFEHALADTLAELSQRP